MNLESAIWLSHLSARKEEYPTPATKFKKTKKQYQDKDKIQIRKKKGNDLNTMDDDGVVCTRDVRPSYETGHQIATTQ